MNNTIRNTMQLGSLISKLKGNANIAYGNPGVEIASIEYNSKNVKENSLFAAVEGFATDGHTYIGDAIKKGAGAVLISKDRIQEFSDLKKNGVALVTAKDTRRALSSISAAFYGYPSERAMVAGITGTNGKTSITYMMESVFKDAGFNPGVIGTINYRWGNKAIAAPNTTPESTDLQRIMAEMVGDGVDVIIMEVSSHSLKLFRVEDIDFNIAVFTNLTRDHLDFHESFEDYFLSKRKIFELLEKSGKDNKAAVINMDDEYGRRIYNEKSVYSFPVLTFGKNGVADFKPVENSITSGFDGIGYTMEKPVAGVEVRLNLPGSFQVYNSLCAFAACYAMGISAGSIKKGLSDLKSIPGRFNMIKSGSGFNVIVDYAHTDDGVSKLLASAKELSPGRIITLLGCGGDRDKTKRPIMGRTAVHNSDWVIFTSDNPRSEDPDDIIKDIVAGIDKQNFEIIADRERAIKKVIFMAEKDDLVVIAGKGHEDYQDIKGKKRHFDDHEIAKKYIDERERQ